MDSLLPTSGASIGVQQDPIIALPSSRVNPSLRPASSPRTTTHAASAQASITRAPAEADPLPGILTFRDALSDLYSREELIDKRDDVSFRRGLTGPTRSVEVQGDQMVALGRKVLSHVPPDVKVSPCKPHDGSAAADIQGVFLGADSLDPTSRHVFSLGILRNLRFLGCFRFNLWWMTQASGSNGREIPCETQFLLLECPAVGKGVPDPRSPPNRPLDSIPRLRGSQSNQAVGDWDTVYVAVLPVLEGSFRSSLQGGFDDQLCVCAESGDPLVTSMQALQAVYMHAGRNPYRTISEAVRAVEAHTGTFARRESKMLPGMLDYFGWCTWDAFYTDVNVQGVTQGLESLAKGGTPAKFLIIDDGWLSAADDNGIEAGEFGTHWKRRLTSIEENKKFKAGSGVEIREHGGAEVNGEVQTVEGPQGTVLPEGEDKSAVALTTAVEEGGAASLVQENTVQCTQDAQEPGPVGLQKLVQDIKGIFSVKYVYVWHAIIGYWGGVKPGADGGMERFESVLQYPEPSSGILTNFPDLANDRLILNGLGVVNPKKAFNFYDELHSYLASCGVDGVKVDSQNILETLGSGHGGRVALARDYHSALESSIRKNFAQNDIICCMSHNTDGLYLAKQNAVMRVSDDFWPNNPASHTAHIISVAFNSLFLGEFMMPDWDMFHSEHPAAEFHGAARAAGGCAVYVSDKPDKHNFDVLRKLVLPDGGILRARLPGRATKDCLFVDPARDARSLLKIWNLNSCTGIVAAFNCQGAAWDRDTRKYTIYNPEPGTVTGVVSADDIDALAEVAPYDWSGDVAVYMHFSDELVTLPHKTSLVTSLPPLRCEVFTMSPVKVLGEAEFAPVGFGRMYNAGGAILSCEYFYKGKEWASTTQDAGYYKATLRVRAGGMLFVYSSKNPLRVLCDGRVAAYSYNPDDGRLTLDLVDATEPVQIDFVY